MFELRDYQKDAVRAILNDMENECATLVVLPTGAGKSLVIAEVANRIGTPVLILAPSKEIVDQNASKMRLYVPVHEIGIYSASMGLKQIRKYTFATIQSVYKKPEFFAHFDTFIMDECDTMNVKNADSMFTQFIKNVNAIRARM